MRQLYPQRISRWPLSIVVVMSVGCSGTAMQAPAEVAQSRRSAEATTATNLTARTIRLEPVVQGGRATGGTTLRNDRKGPLDVAEIRTSCECLSVSLPKRVFAPGEDIQLKLRFDFQDEPEFVGGLCADVQAFDSRGAEVLQFNVAIDGVGRDGHIPTPESAVASDQ